MPSFIKYSYDLILASNSPYRLELLNRLGLTFQAHAPKFDEEKHKDPSLTPRELTQKLSYLKAKSLQEHFPQAFIIGSDQVLSFEGRIYGKPHTKEVAYQTLSRLSGKTHELLTAVCILGPKDQRVDHINSTKLTMKTLSLWQLKAYVDLDMPLDCAGAYKIEKSGIALFDKIETDDFTAIQGLPLMWLSSYLEQVGFPSFSAKSIGG